MQYSLSDPSPVEQLITLNVYDHCCWMTARNKKKTASSEILITLFLYFVLVFNCIRIYWYIQNPFASKKGSTINSFSAETKTIAPHPSVRSIEATEREYVRVYLGLHAFI